MMKGVELYVKWQRNLYTKEDTYFKEFEKNMMHQRRLKREMNKLLIDLKIPLYYSFSKIQFNDTLNAIIQKVYKLMHEKVVDERDKMIERKLLQNEKLKGFESIEKGSKAFWSLPNS